MISKVWIRLQLVIILLYNSLENGLVGTLSSLHSACDAIGMNLPRPIAH